MKFFVYCSFMTFLTALVLNMVMPNSSIKWELDIVEGIALGLVLGSTPFWIQQDEPQVNEEEWFKVDDNGS